MNKIIFVEGIPGCGKSTTSQFIYEQLIKNNYNAVWLHEGLDDHPLWEERENFFNDDGYIDVEHFDEYTNTLIDKFKHIKSQIEENDEIYVIDGHIFTALANVYHKSDCDANETLKYYKRVEKSLRQLNPLLIYLETDRVREHTIETWESRAMWGKKVVTKAYGRIPYVKRGNHEGDDILFAYINPLQDQNLEYFDLTEFDKLKFNIDKREYIKYNYEILSHLNLNSIPNSTDPKGIDRYVGVYDNDRDKENMFVKVKDDSLVCDWGEMNMELLYVEPNIYNLRSYPIYLKFREENKEIVGVDTYGRQCYRRANCHFDKTEETKYEIRK